MSVLSVLSVWSELIAHIWSMHAYKKLIIRETDKTDKTDMQNLTKLRNCMARVTFTPGIKNARGRSGKGSKLYFRKKEFCDPLTDEVLKEGPNEWYHQNDRDYTKSPLTEAEKKQRVKWSDACRQSQLIKNDRTHPRYAELHAAWRAQIHDPDGIIQFGNYICSMLARKQ